MANCYFLNGKCKTGSFPALYRAETAAAAACNNITELRARLRYDRRQYNQKGVSMPSHTTRRKASVNQALCVACGCCVKVCPRSAIEIIRGVMAQVNQHACVGCGKCAAECPASVIAMQEVPA